MSFPVFGSKLRSTLLNWAPKLVALEAQVNTLQAEFLKHSNFEDWTPIYGAGFAIDTPYYSKVAKAPNSNLAHCIIAANGTTSGGPAYLTFSLPFIVANLANSQWNYVGIVDGGGLPSGNLILIQNTTEARVYRDNFTNWTNGTNREFLANFFYMTK